jgi:DNA-binding NarL/FixJ family response regulator
MADGLRVVIASSDDLIRQLLTLACSRQGVEVVGEPVTSSRLFECCAASDPHVVVTCDRLDDQPVEAFLDALLVAGARVIVVSDDPSPDRLGSLLAREVAGFFSHDAGPDEVVAGIVAARRGELVLNAAVSSTIIRQWRRMRLEPPTAAGRGLSLTPRESDILSAMAEGLPAKAIAGRLGVALKTVENHKIRIFDKLGVRSQAHAVTVAHTLGLAPSCWRATPGMVDPASGFDLPLPGSTTTWNTARTDVGDRDDGV